MAMGNLFRKVHVRLFFVTCTLINFVHLQYALGVYEQIMEAGTKWGIRNAGWYSLDSLRLEKSQLWWGVELGTRITPCEAGLMHTVDMTKVCTLQCIMTKGTYFCNDWQKARTSAMIDKRHVLLQ